MRFYVSLGTLAHVTGHILKQLLRWKGHAVKKLKLRSVGSSSGK